MPRALGETTNEVSIHDNLSNSPIVFRYRMPTTKERVAYDNESIQRKGKKIKMRQAEARLKFGGMILTGFGPGDFTKTVDGKNVPIASDPDHPNYDPDWKKRVMEEAADLVMLLAGHVFDIPAYIDDDDEDDDEDTPDEDADRD